MTPLQIALLNRWASYRVSVGLARACGWPKPARAIRDADEYFGKTWDDLVTQVLAKESV